MPLSLPGFCKVKRYWDTVHEIYLARILPGEYYVTIANELIATMLGSCVSACIRDTQTGVGGMNHFMLPSTDKCASDPGECKKKLSRYGSAAMEHMINDILLHGGRRENLEVKLFGGGRVLQSTTDVGENNIEFVRNYLRDTGLTVTSEDLGGTYPRKILYFPASGRVLMRKMPISNRNKHVQREDVYRQSLAGATSGEIDFN
ncbi:MAG: chemotaxis protein CheD [SAR86 cluster bacterium]|uniref:Probable chemoreceptor glutamine deamidase CheD n=1 Tax=SAR86 cluster bacterium TaxID=2030880 RepID=A0A2A5AXE1_9GAMM|nr:MAG: chemotaxis protein CheD [SAR86 cluster bacterium]